MDCRLSKGDRALTPAVPFGLPRRFRGDSPAVASRGGWDRADLLHRRVVHGFEEHRRLSADRRISQRSRQCRCNSERFSVRSQAATRSAPDCLPRASSPQSSTEGAVHSSESEPGDAAPARRLPRAGSRVSPPKPTPAPPPPPHPGGPLRGGTPTGTSPQHLSAKALLCGPFPRRSRLSRPRVAAVGIRRARRRRRHPPSRREPAACSAGCVRAGRTMRGRMPEARRP